MIFTRQKLLVSVVLSVMTIFSLVFLPGCAKSIEQMKSTGDIKGLIEAATKDCTSYSQDLAEKRESAKEALFEIGTPVIEPMKSALLTDERGDEHRCVVIFAIEFLGEMKEAEAAEGLIDFRFFSNVYKQPAWEMDAEAAIYNIGPAAFDPMMDALNSSNSDAVSFAFEFLSAYETELLESEYRPAYIESFIGLLNEEAYFEDALYALCRSADASAMDVLADYMDQEIVADEYFTAINVQYIQPVLVGQAINATPYLPGAPSPHPVVIEDDGFFDDGANADGQLYSMNWNAALPLNWRALGEPESVQLILCWDKIEYDAIETAIYSDGSTGERLREVRTVSLREAATGEIVATNTFYGEDPEDLPSEKNWQGPVTELGKISPDALIEWLRFYVED